MFENQAPKRFLRAAAVTVVALGALAVLFAVSSQQGVAPKADIEQVVKLGEYRFDPDTIVAKQGNMLRLKVVNEGAEEHNLYIDRYSVQTRILKPGESDILEIRVDYAGDFSILCGVSSHSVEGMKGTLRVLPKG